MVKNWSADYILITMLCFLTSIAFTQNKLSTHSRLLMGTKFTILLPSNPINDSIAEIAFNEIERLNLIFSTYNENSEVSKLNRSNKWIKISEEMISLINFSENLNRNTQGAFDIKIGNIIKIWKAALKNKKLPSAQLIKKEFSKKRKIKIKGQKVKTNKNTQLDFGGIAKGYAVDQAFLKLKSMGYDTLLIDGGGDIRMGEAPHHRPGWKIMVSNDPGKLLILKNCAIATSGYEYQHLSIGNITYSHIIDPRNFQSIEINRGVSIIADDCTTADALATSFSVNSNISDLHQLYNYKVRIKENKQFIVNEF